MGYDERTHSSSSATLVAVVVAALIAAILAILFVVGAGLFWVRASRNEARAIAIEQQVASEIRQAEVMSRLHETQPRILSTTDPRLTFTVQLDRDGTASIDGETIGLEELRVQLAKLKDETSNAFSVCVNANAECPVKHVTPLLDVCEDVGDIDYRVAIRESEDVASEGHDSEGGSLE